MARIQFPGRPPEIPPAPLTQAQLGDRLKPYLGTTWPAQAVSDVERGARLTPRNLCAFAAALEVPSPAWFFPVWEPTVLDMGDGRTVTIGKAAPRDASRSEELSSAQADLEKATADLKNAQDAIIAARLRLAGLESVTDETRHTDREPTES